MHVRTALPFVAALFAAVALTGCAGTDAHHAADHPSAHAGAHAVAVVAGPALAIAHVAPTQGHQARGWVRFQQVEGGVRVTAEISGLTPNGTHAIHVHEFGDCSAPDGMSAGGHYNPGGHPHAGPGADVHHAGDFGNLQADAAGVARLDFVAKDLSVSGAHHPVLGRSVVIHAQADDLVTQPTGNAGGRIGCGVVGVAKPDAPK